MKLRLLAPHPKTKVGETVAGSKGRGEPETTVGVVDVAVEAGEDGAAGAAGVAACASRNNVLSLPFI